MTAPALKHILFVEDDPDIQAVASLALQALGGFEITICNSGREALTTAPGSAADLILLDVMMPGLDGPSTLAELRRLPELQCTPVIFMTAKAQRHEIEYYRTLGALDVIAKPFDPMTLASTLQALWRDYHAGRTT